MLRKSALALLLVIAVALASCSPATTSALALATVRFRLTIAATNNGALQAYAGPVTTIGWLLARAVRESPQQSLAVE